jgi:hypothetical protein
MGIDRPPVTCCRGLRPEAIARRGDRWTRWKAEVLAHYGRDGKLRCVWEDCLVDDIDMLSLDHKENNGTAERKKYGSGLYLYLRKTFPEGYQTLCHNHQWKKEIVRRRSARLEREVGKVGRTERSVSW